LDVVDWPTFRIKILCRHDEQLDVTTDIHGATLAGFKRHVLPNATEPELDVLRIAIYHPDLPSFLPGSVERPNSDGHLRAILSKYYSIGLYDLALDLETPERKYNDYTVLDGRRRYGCPPDVIAKLPILIPLDWSDREPALQRLYAEVESRLKLKKLRPAAAVSCFFVHACSLFPALTLQFDEPMSSNQGQGTIDIAITSSASTSCVVGFVTINKDFETALTWNMVQLESTAQRHLHSPRKRKFHDSESSKILSRCGIATDGFQWQAVHYSFGSNVQTLPTFHTSSIPCIFQWGLNLNWRKDVETIFTHIVCLMNGLSEGMLHEADQDERKRRC